jgi:hypothetical protein
MKGSSAFPNMRKFFKKNEKKTTGLNGWQNDATLNYSGRPLPHSSSVFSNAGHLLCSGFRFRETSGCVAPSGLGKATRLSASIVWH